MRTIAPALPTEMKHWDSFSVASVARMFIRVLGMAGMVGWVGVVVRHLGATPKRLTLPVVASPVLVLYRLAPKPGYVSPNASSHRGRSRSMGALWRVSLCNRTNSEAVFQKKVAEAWEILPERWEILPELWEIVAELWEIPAKLWEIPAKLWEIPAERWEKLAPIRGR